jgi:hypothetical protein
MGNCPTGQLAFLRFPEGEESAHQGDFMPNLASDKSRGRRGIRAAIGTTGSSRGIALGRPAGESALPRVARAAEVSVQ